MARLCVNVLVVYCHPDAGLVRRIRPRSGGRRARPATAERPRRPTCTPMGSIRCFDAHDRRTHLEPGSRAGTAALRRRSALVRDARARLPDLVERAAGDAEGLDRPGVGERCGVDHFPPARTGIRPLLRNVRRIVVVTTHGSSKLGQLVRRAKAASASSPAPCARSAAADAARRGWRCTASTRRPLEERQAFLDRVERRLGEAVDAAHEARRSTAGEGDRDLGGDAALFSASARLAGMLRPSVASAMRPSTNGVTAAPMMPARSQSSRARVEHGVELVGIEFVGLGDRHAEQDARRRPGRDGAASPRPRAAESTRCGTRSPDERV